MNSSYLSVLYQGVFMFLVSVMLFLSEKSFTTTLLTCRYMFFLLFSREFSNDTFGGHCHCLSRVVPETVNHYIRESDITLPIWSCRESGVEVFWKGISVVTKDSQWVRTVRWPILCYNSPGSRVTGIPRDVGELEHLLRPELEENRHRFLSGEDASGPVLRVD